ncbi:MAG: monovalent cation/H+ antiporter complex subunit F [Pseudomonadota bacterium]
MSMLGATLSGPVGWAAAFCGLMIMVAIVCAVYRLVKGETLPDRVVALDLISMLLTALIVVFALAVEVSAYLDAALALALISFLATVAFARYVERRAGYEAPSAPAPEPDLDPASPAIAEEGKPADA